MSVPKRLPPSLFLLAVAAGSLAAACSPDAGAVEPAKKIVFYNWFDYIVADFYPEFQAETGIEVEEANFDSYQEMIAALEKGSSEYALVMADARALGALIASDELAELDHDHIPNLSNIYPRFQKNPYDDGNRYGVPYLWGMTGLGYNADAFQAAGVDAPASLDVLFAPGQAPFYEGKATILDDGREAFAAALLHLGEDVNTTDPQAIESARDLLVATKPILAAKDPFDIYFGARLGAGEIYLAHGWSGDTLLANDVDGAPKVEFVVPAEGGVIWTDHICIPSGTPPDQKLAAEMFIDFLLRPENGARLAEYKNFPTPNQASEALLDAAFLGNQAIYPPDDVLDRLHYLLDVGDATNALYEQAWEEVKAAP